MPTAARSDVEVVGARKAYGDVVAVDDVDLEVAAGSFFTLLGPSGSGKTTTLRLIAGFERPDAGTIRLGGEDITDRPPYSRDVNTVFQDYALFPHMTVAENVGYGLRVKGVGRARRPGRRRAEDGPPRRLRRPQAGAALGRPAAARRARPLDRQPAEGAAARRAARRARSQAAPGDAALPEGAPAGSRHDVHLRHARPGGGADDERPGRRLQRGTDRAGRRLPEVYERPATEFVAGFVGTSNIVERDGRRVCVRPERISFDSAGDPATIDDVVFVGAFTRYLVATDRGERLAVVAQNDRSPLARGARVQLAWRDEDAFQLPALQVSDRREE